MSWAAAAQIGAEALDKWLVNENAKDAARENRNFQERMSNTAYQRAANDLEAAGLNRVLALGQGASTPSGATAVVSPYDLGKTGIMASSAKQQIAQSQAEERLLDQRKNESSANEQLALTHILTAKTQADLNAATARLTAARAAKEERYVPVHESIGDTIKEVTDSLPELKYLPGFLQEKASNAKDWLIRKLEGPDKVTTRRNKEWVKDRFTNDHNRGLNRD